MIKCCLINKTSNILGYFQSFTLLFIRLLLVYGFYEPALNKYANVGDIAQWFAQLNIPFPLFSAYMATYTEIFGVIFLTLGIFTRFISLALIILLIVAIITVHLPNGFSVANNGFEIPLYFIAFLFTLMSFGAGKISLDFWIKRYFNENTSS